MNELFYALTGGAISGAFSAGLVIANQRNIMKEIIVISTRLNDHINAHAEGHYDRRTNA